MKCDVIRKDISAYIDGELSGNENSIVETHFQKCPDCKRIFNEFTAQSKALREVAEIEPSPDFDVRFRAKVTKQDRRIPLAAEWPSLIFSPARLVFASIILGVLVGGVIGRITFTHYLSSTPTKNMYFERFSLYAFNDFPRGSLGNAYLTLSTKR